MGKCAPFMTNPPLQNPQRARQMSDNFYDDIKREFEEGQKRWKELTKDWSEEDRAWAERFWMNAGMPRG